MPSSSCHGAGAVARDLYRAWPKLTPEDAVAFYFTPFTQESSTQELF